MRRVAASSTFERSHRLRTFFLHVCRCALDNHPEAATEQQIGIHVFGRPAAYNPNEDNIVRSQARLLRLKLEHHFANEGKDEPLVISIPKGQYLPVFDPRPVNGFAPAPPEAKPERRVFWRPAAFTALGLVVVVAATWAGYSWIRSRTAPPASAVLADASQPGIPAVPAGTPPGVGEVRIAAGHTGEPLVDMWGRRWDSDRYYEGGVVRPGPQGPFPTAPNPGLFKTIREAATGAGEAPLALRSFKYHIPVPPGVYELRLYFADPIHGSKPEKFGDGQNFRHFLVNLNGRSLLWNFDAISDAVPAPFDVRAFRDVTPASDGKVHLEFMTGPEPPFVSAIELTPGERGRMRPIRLTARRSDFVDAEGVRWSADNYYLNGQTAAHATPQSGSPMPALYSHERYGNFLYAIPVAPGSYTVKLHFAETFFTGNPEAFCRGEGCRVFDVQCNGLSLIRGLDIFTSAGGAFRPIVRTFRGLEPNGQGKLLLSFSPRVNYASIRAIEVLDEAQ